MFVSSVRISSQRFRVESLELCTSGFSIAAVGAFLGFLGWQIFTWLQSGEWPALPAASVGLFWIGQEWSLGLMIWAVEPESWIGLHTFLDWFSVGTALGFLFVGIALVFAMLASQADDTLWWLLSEQEAHDRKENQSKKHSPTTVTGTAPSVKQQPVVDNEVSEADLTDEEQEKYIKLLQRVQLGCQIAEGSLEGMDGSGSEDDIYEKERVEKYVKTSLSLAEEIQDGFYKSSALHFISDLLSKAGQYDRASKLIEQISEDLIQKEATEFLAQQKSLSTEHSPTT